MKPSVKDIQDHQQKRELVRLLTGIRRPEHVPMFRDYYMESLSATPEGMLARRYKTNRSIVGSEGSQEHLARLTVGRDQVVKKQVQHPDTMLYFASGVFCDLIAATDTPNVTDLSVLRNIGNQTAMVLYEHNVRTAVAADDLVAVVLHLANEANVADGKPRLFGSVIHTDGSVSTFMYPFVEIHPNLAQVDWDAGVNERAGDLSIEEQMVSNTFGLLAQERLYTQIKWDHYPKQMKAHAKAARRRLPRVNVIGLQVHTQRSLNDHQEATQVQRDGWWPVKGHFRLQPCGPGRSLRKQIYIAPTVKGNLEGPNIGRTQIHKTA